MHALNRFLRSLAFLFVALAGLAGAARAADVSQAVLLVASHNPANSNYERTVILVAPLPEGGHIGFILNRPSGVKLETLFPEQSSTRHVVDQVYIGGPVQTNALIAVTRHVPLQGTHVELMPGLVAVLDADSVDHVIENSPNEARYFLGCALWDDGDLAREIDDGAWIVRRVDAASALPGDSADLWEQLSGELAWCGSDTCSGLPRVLRVHAELPLSPIVEGAGQAIVEVHAHAVDGARRGTTVGPHPAPGIASASGKTTSAIWRRRASPSPDDTALFKRNPALRATQRPRRPPRTQ